MARGSSLPTANLNAVVDSLSEQYKEIAQSANDFSVAMQSALNANMEARSSTIYKNIDKAVRQMEGVGHNLVEYQKQIEESTKEIEDSTSEIKKLNDQIAKTTDDNHKFKLEELKVQQEEILLKSKDRKREMEHLIKLEDRHAQIHKDKIEYFEKELEFQKDSIEELTRDIKNAGGKTAYGLKGAGDMFSGAVGASFDNILSGAEGKITKLGSLLSGIGGKTGSGFMSGMGSFLGKAGPVVGGLVAVGQAALDADKKIKEANAGILQTSNYADFTGPSLQGLNERLGEARKAFLSLNAELGMDDSKEVFSSLSQAGFDFRMMGRDTNKMKGLMKELAKGSASLGLGFSEGAEFMAELRKEMGITELNKVGDAFVGIRDAALKANMNTKDLADSVKRLYSGLGKFNVGIHQVTNTFLKLRKVIGKEAAEQMLESLKGGYSESGVKERIEAGLKMGEGKMKKIVSRTAGRSTRNLMESIQGNKYYQQMFAAGGFTATSGAGLQKELASLSPEERAKRFAAMRQAGEAGGAPIEDIEAFQGKMRSAANVSKGAQGSIRGGGLLRGMNEIDVAGMLSAKILGVAGLGGKFKEGRLHQLQAPEEIAAIEQMTGLSGKQLTIMQNITEDMEGEMLNLQEKAKKAVGTGPEAEKARAELVAKGYQVGEGGKLLKEGEEVTFEKYLEINEKELDKRAKEQGAVEVTTQDMLKEQIMATRSVADQINAKLGPYLDSLNSTVSAWFDMTRTDKSKDTRKGVTKELDKDIAEYDRLSKMKGVDAKVLATAKAKAESAQAQKKYLATADFGVHTSKEFMKAKAKTEGDLLLNPNDEKALARKKVLELAEETGIYKEGGTGEDMATKMAKMSESKMSKEQKDALFKSMKQLGYKVGGGFTEKGDFSFSKFEKQKGTSDVFDSSIQTGQTGSSNEPPAAQSLNTIAANTMDEKEKEAYELKLEEKKATNGIVTKEKQKEREDLVERLSKENKKNYQVADIMKEIENLATENNKLIDFYTNKTELETALTKKDAQAFTDIYTRLGLDQDTKGFLAGETFVNPKTGNDWIKVGNEIHKFSSSDVALGIDPTGVKGPLKNVIGGMGGGKGMINITINGGDEQRVYAVVQRALADAGYNS
jgi:hypothetical protein